MDKVPPSPFRLQIMSVLLFIEHSVEVAHGKASCKLSQTGYLRIADLISSFLLITMLFVISVSLLVGVVKVRALRGKRHGRGAGLGEPQLPSYPLLLTPTGWAELAAEMVEEPREVPAALHVPANHGLPAVPFTLLGSYVELPAYLKFVSRSRAHSSKVPVITLQLLDFCLSILTLCSSYMEVPTYLNFNSMNHMNYLPSQEEMAYNQFVKMMIIFSIAFITVLILKVYMFKCVWRCYRLIKCMNSAEEKSSSKMLQKVVLPSYEEAVSLPSKTPEGDPAPPPYSEV
ncbi:hypothetical protein QTO34_018852 [Cnephaeus nilssonii]|uniref:Lysosomal-associated transmembrane protein 5 n=1 Tax=Cnephaeus nilssonii TaxID=3371016 RepID=A0AA40HZM9_CNENI|nr:hypothetical protein QTO34_018852 [Eptesicus nilssonii]